MGEYETRQEMQVSQRNLVKNILNNCIYATNVGRDNKVNTGSNITDRRHECRSLKNSQYKRTTGDNQEIKI
jgi:hypothetical protein